jgi:hypothetical protein
LPVTAVDVVGSQVTFTAVFTASSPITYQWQIISGGVTNNISGATNTTLTLANLQLTNTASYQVQASNAYGVAVGSPSSLTVSNMPTAVNNLITAMAAQTGTGNGTFTPTWTVTTNNSLIAGMAPSTALGNFSEEISGRSVNSLTTSNNLGITLITGPGGITSSTNYVTCGNGSSAGSTIVYSLPAATYGYDLTNIMVYGGWASNSRDQQAYTVYYSTVPAATTFILLGSVNYNPVNPGSVQSATRATLTAANGVLATNVAAVKFNFATPASENGYCGYAEINVLGTATIPPAVPASLNATMVTPDTFVMNVGGLVIGRNYILQSTTNLTSAVWSIETNFVAIQTTFSFNNSSASDAQRFYRVEGY